MDLLRLAGFEFDAQKSGFPEVTLESPLATATENARGKALAVARHTEHVVLGSDTVVYSPDLPPGERVLGQAQSAENVRRMLGALRGRVHEVHSGVAVARGEEVEVRHAVTKVRMRALDDSEVERYARFGDGVGKAGGYAIQGKAAPFVEWVGGDYTNVVGLPLALTVRMLGARGIHPR